MILGAHMSTAGGVNNSLLRGREVGCDTIQIFTKNNNRWMSKPLADDEIGRYLETQEETGITPVVSHTGYLINLASPLGSEVCVKSIEAMLDELKRAEVLRIPCVVVHPGSHRGDGEGVGIQRIADRINELIGETKGFKAMIALETTAGQGTNLAYTFEQIAAIMGRVHNKKRIGVCLDTCHIFAAGYDIRTPETYKETMCHFDEIVGLDNLKVIHFNDSKTDFGSRRDRHEHIGTGFIGKIGLKNFLKDPRLENIPIILETPKDNDLKFDKMNMARIRALTCANSN